jgi:ATP-dependent protease ClpP protease subunit
VTPATPSPPWCAPRCWRRSAVASRRGALGAPPLLFLESDAPYEPLSLYNNSPGSVVTAGLAICARAAAAAEEACAFGIVVDEVVERRPREPAPPRA